MACLRKLLFYFLLANLSILPLCAMDFKHLSIEDGLSNSTVFSIIQDSRGLFWFGTRSGIDSYDGYSFTHYELIPSPNSISLQAKDLLIDSRNTFWVGTTNGLFRYNHLSKRFELASERFANLQNFSINKLLADNDGDIWMTTTKATYYYQPATDTLIQIGGSNIPASDILQISDQQFLLATATGLLVADKNRNSAEPFDPVCFKGRFKQQFISCLYKDGIGQIWISTQDNGLYIYRPDKEELVLLESVTPFISSGELIRDIEETRKGTYLLGTDGNGLLTLNNQYEVIGHDAHAEDRPQSISTNGIYEIFLDNDHRTWISTYGGGINVSDPNLLAFKSFTHITNSHNSLINNSGRTAIEDSRGNLWFGTQRGISIYTPATGKWSHIYNETGQPNRIGKNTILTLCQVSPESVWAGSYGGGIDVISTTDFSSKPLFPRTIMNEKLGSPYVYSIYKSRGGDLWIGVLRQQLIRYTPATGAMTRYPIINIKEISETSRGEMLLGSREAFYRLNIASGKFVRYEHNPSDPNTMKSCDVNSAVEGDDGCYYLGTEGGGLHILDPKTGKFRIYTIDDGLPSNTILSIKKTSDNQFWISTTSGISVFLPTDESFTNYDTSDGLPIKEFNLGAACQLRNGDIVMGGNKGFVLFNPREIRKITIPPKLIFTDMKVDNRSVQIGQSGSPLQKDLDLTDHLTLRYNQNSFSFTFVGLNYTNPVKNTYSWKLEGFDRDWTPASRNNTATYTNMPYGTYTLRVRCSNLHNEWNGGERTLTIEIKPPFYLTKQAFVLYLILVSVLLYWIVKFMRIRYQEKHAKEKVQFFINLAHDLRTPLTLIQSPLSTISENKNLSETDKNCVELARRNADKLGQLFNQLLDFQKADLNKLQLQVAEYDVASHLTDVVTTFGPLLTKRHLVCELTTDLKRLTMLYDRDKIDKVFFNLLSNAIKYSYEGGLIRIRLNTDKKNCIIEVEDNGIGIPVSQQNMVFRGYYRATNAINSKETGSGVGLVLVKHLVEQHHGAISFASKAGDGTTFRVVLPLKSKRFKPEDYRTDDNISAPLLPDRVTPEAVPPIDETVPQTAADKEKTPSVKLVIAEDSEDLRTFLEQQLSSRYKVYVAENGKIALNLIDKVHPDLVISDVMMPEMDGNTLCAHLKKHIETCHIPVILLTALTDSDYKIDGFEAGADEYLEKPFDVKVLLSRIENLLRSRAILKDKFLRFNNPSEKVDYKSKMDQEFILKAVETINQNLTDTEFSVEELCKKLYMSRPVLYRKLKALTDQSPQDFIKIIRLKKAVEYLNQSGDNINEIAYKTGFADPKYFSTCFRKYYGLSPSQYQKQQD